MLKSTEREHVSAAQPGPNTQHLFKGQVLQKQTHCATAPIILSKAELRSKQKVEITPKFGETVTTWGRARGEPVNLLICCFFLYYFAVDAEGLRFGVGLKTAVTLHHVHFAALIVPSVHCRQFPWNDRGWNLWFYFWAKKKKEKSFSAVWLLTSHAAISAFYYPVATAVQRNYSNVHKSMSELYEDRLEKIWTYVL